MSERTVAKEFMNIYASWRKAEPKSPTKTIQTGDGEGTIRVSIDDGAGDLRLDFNSGKDIGGETYFLNPEAAHELKQFIQECFTDFSIAARPR